MPLFRRRRQYSPYRLHPQGLRQSLSQSQARLSISRPRRLRGWLVLSRLLVPILSCCLGQRIPLPLMSDLMQGQEEVQCDGVIQQLCAQLLIPPRDRQWQLLTPGTL